MLVFLRHTNMITVGQECEEKLFAENSEQSGYRVPAESRDLLVIFLKSCEAI